MQYAVERPAGQQTPGDRNHVAVDELRTRRDRIGVPGRQVVDDHYLMVLFQKDFGAHAADIAGAPGYQQLHSNSAACSTMFTSTRTPTASARSSMSKSG